MIKILHVVPSLDINAGMMSVVMNYYRKIDRSKVQFEFLYFYQAEYSHQVEIETLGGHVYYIGKPSFMLGYQKKLQFFFNEHKGEYTAVHCHPIWASEIVAYAAKKNGVHHVIQHAHSTKYSEKKISAIRNRLLINFISFFATDYMACNKEAAQLFGRKIAANGKVFVLPNAIDLHRYEFNKSSRIKIRNEFGASADTILLGSVGRLSVEKNQCFIVETFKFLHEKHPNSKLILVGDGGLRVQIEHKVLELGLTDSVIMTGKRTDVGKILSALDLFMMPSIFEGTPVSAIEARTSGLPCLLSDTITKSVDMKGVKFFSIQKSPEEWAEELEKMFSKSKNINRYDYSEVIDHGFDINTEAVKLEKYYLGLR